MDLPVVPASAPLPAPIAVELVQLPPHPCSYLAGREATSRAFLAGRLDPLVYHELMNASFRRSGILIYQPVCAGCRECVPLRVPVAEFRPSKSQRRCWRRNTDLIVAAGAPEATEEKFDLYARYQKQWHQDEEPATPEDFVGFLYRSPVETVEFSYRDARDRLVAVGICDVCPKSLSTVYFFFDPAESRRGLGTFGALWEIEHARRERIDYFYLGFWVKESAKMAYKADFRPYELLQADGSWLRISN